MFVEAMQEFPYLNYCELTPLFADDNVVVERVVTPSGSISWEINYRGGLKFSMPHPETQEENEEAIAALLQSYQRQMEAGVTLSPDSKKIDGFGWAIRKVDCPF